MRGIANVKLADLGRAKRITIDKDNTTIVEGYGIGVGEEGPRRGCAERDARGG